MGSPISQPHDDPALEQLQSMLAPATQGAEKTEAKPTNKEQAVSSSGDWVRLTFASRDLTELASLLDATLGASPTTDVGAVASATNYATFDDAKTAATDAKTTLLGASDFQTFSPANQQLQNAVGQMESLASDDTQRTEAATWKTALADAKPDLDGINSVGVFGETIEPLKTSLPTADEAGLAAAKATMEGEGAALAILERLTTGEKTKDYAVVTDLAGKVPATATEVDAIIADLTSVQTALTKAEEALASAKKNNVPENLDRCDVLIKESEVEIAALQKKYPDSPIVKAATEKVAAIREEFETIDPLIVRNPEVSAGAAASTQKTISEDRVSMLFGDLDNEIADTIMQGLRQMIQNFDGETPMSEQALQRTAAELDAISQKLGPEQAAAGELRSMKEALQSGTKGAALANALSTIGAAAVGGGGAFGIKAALSAMLMAGFGPTGSSLTSGYSAYQSINDAMARGNRETQQVLGRTTSAFLSERLPSARTDSQTNSPSARLANAIVGNSRTIGDIFAATQAVQTMTQVLLSTPNANAEEIRAKLTAAVTKAPQSGFPYVQISEGSLQNLADAVLQARADAERAAAGSKEAEFSSAPAFIQQVLVNIGSLFAGYLQ